MKLFVDDIRNAPDESWTVVRTVTEAIRAISRYDFETISLDHDISHQVHIGELSRPYPCGETFEAVAYYIATKYKGVIGSSWSPVIILHTSNQVAGDRMGSILAEAGIGSKKQYMGAANRLEMEI